MIDQRERRDGEPSMAAMIFNAPPQFGQFSMSMSKAW
jgi:hypothetical protein